MQMDSVKILSRKIQIPFTILCYNKMYDTYERMLSSLKAVFCHV